MNQYLFGYEFKHYCTVCSGVRSAIYQHYYPTNAPPNTKREFPCHTCEILRSNQRWLVYER